MTDTNVIKLAQPGTFTDSLTEILRNGARALLTQAVHPAARIVTEVRDVTIGAGAEEASNELSTVWKQFRDGAKGSQK